MVDHPRARKSREEYFADAMLLGMQYDITSHVFVYPGPYKEGDFKDADTLEPVTVHGSQLKIDFKELARRRREYADAMEPQEVTIGGNDAEHQRAGAVEKAPAGRDNVGPRADNS